MTVKLYRNARVFTPLDSGHPLRGKEQGKIKEYSRGVILTVNGVIVAIGDEKEVLNGLSSPSFVNEERDMEGACVIPGFVDPHTHLCFAKRREDEFKMRLDGLPYLEILKRGGGILSSVKAVRSVTEEELFCNTKKLAMVLPFAEDRDLKKFSPKSLQQMIAAEMSKISHVSQASFSQHHQSQPLY